MRAGARSTVGAGAAVAALAASLLGCGEDTVSRGATPSPAHLSIPAVPSPAGAMAVLVEVPGGAGSATYTVALVDTSGRTVASTTAPRRTIDGSGSTCTVSRLPSVSATAHRVYYLAGDAELRYLDPDGSNGAVRSLADPGTTEVAFAVSPDESRVAVTSITAGDGAFHESLRVEALDGSSSATIATSTVAGNGPGRITWVVGWVGGGLAVASGIPVPQSGCHAPAQPTGYDVVDAVTGARRAHLCGGTVDATPSGPPVSAGVLCIGHDTAARPVQAVETISGWDGATHPVRRGLCGFTGALAPDGATVAAVVDLPSGGGCGPGDGRVHLVGRNGADRPTSVPGTPLGWLDRDHILVSSGDGLRVVTLPGGAGVAASAGGDLEAILPTPLA